MLTLPLKGSITVGPGSEILRDLVVLGGLPTLSLPRSHCGLHVSALNLGRKMSFMDGCFTCWAEEMDFM